MELVARCRNILPAFSAVLWTIHLPCDIAQSVHLCTSFKTSFLGSSHLELEHPLLGPKSRATGAETGVNSQLGRLKEIFDRENEANLRNKTLGMGQQVI